MLQFFLYNGVYIAETAGSFGILDITGTQPCLDLTSDFHGSSASAHFFDLLPNTNRRPIGTITDRNIIAPFLRKDPYPKVTDGEIGSTVDWKIPNRTVWISTVAILNVLHLPSPVRAH